MLALGIVLGLAVGAVGAVAAWLVARARGAADVGRLTAELEHAQASTEEKLGLLAQAKTELADAFKALSAEALRSNNASFLDLARTQLEQKEQAVEHLVRPLKDSLEKVSTEVRTLEQARRQDYGTLTKHLQTVAETNERVRVETAGLATALRNSEVRGAWGEMQLRNAVEAAGMLAYCDFVEQVTATADGRRLRPDLVVRLPAGRHVVVDAKAPLKALIDAVGAHDDEARATSRKEFARHVREHVAALSAKAYWQQFEPTPDFVIMFLPGESFYREAIELDPRLLEVGSRRVILASPTILITLLKTIALGWREEKIAESARTVSELGRELYERLAVLSEHFVTLGKRLDGAVQAYNQSVGSFERRVLPQARRFVDEGGVTVTRELPSPAPVERSAQPPQTIELPRELPAAEADAA